MTYVVLAIVIRSVIRGELPSAISREGLTWTDEMSATTRAALETLQTQFEILEHDLNELADHVALSRRLP
jgi:BMFP domain-containing protein YqiC